MKTIEQLRAEEIRLARQEHLGSARRYCIALRIERQRGTSHKRPSEGETSWEEHYGDLIATYRQMAHTVSEDEYSHKPCDEEQDAARREVAPLRLVRSRA